MSAATDATDLDLGHREWAFYREAVDPLARSVLRAHDPWQAHEAAVRVGDALAEQLGWLPHGEEVYVAWVELGDLYDLVPRPDRVHLVLRSVADAWLGGSGPSASGSLGEWLDRTHEAIEDAGAR